MKKRMAALLAMAMFTMAAGSASALELTISDGSATSNFNSGISGSNSSTGTGISAISFDSGLFTITNASATTQYNGYNSFVDVSSVVVSYNGSGPKTISLTASDNGFTLNTLAVSPNTQATMIVQDAGTVAPITFQGYYNNALINTLTIPAGGYSAGPVTTAISTSNPFSLTDVVTIAFTGAGETVSLDANLDVVPTPEPGTMVLLGIGMLGLAVCGKRRMSKEA
jgi:hypothetical protein